MREGFGERIDPDAGLFLSVYVHWPTSFQMLAIDSNQSIIQSINYTNGVYPNAWLS